LKLIDKVMIASRAVAFRRAARGFASSSVLPRAAVRFAPSRLQFHSSAVLRADMSLDEAQKIADAEDAAEKAKEDARLASVASTPASPKVQGIVDQLLELSIMETVELTDILKDKFGYVEQAVMAAPAAAAGGAAAAPVEEVVEEKTAFTVSLNGFDAKSKIKVIKEVRALIGLGLKEAKELVEGVPKVLKKDVSKAEADEIMEKLKAVGGECKMD
jgi:large subunit ribosomal protein L7/L12